jgi:hypothetical protein
MQVLHAGDWVALDVSLTEADGSPLTPAGKTIEASALGEDDSRVGGTVQTVDGDAGSYRAVWAAGDLAGRSWTLQVRVTEGAAVETLIAEPASVLASAWA